MYEKYCTDNCISFKGRDVIPRELMQGAKGLAFITVISLAVLVSILHVWQYVNMYVCLCGCMQIPQYSLFFLLVYMYVCMYACNATWYGCRY